ncbi:MAG: D-2-hydroxyacid dehydrogenase [Verrucomicrobiales bacterium]|jgi:glycerate dehydrogenase|nr:D-2-hydroxyacid dehydrogenase [Verrucomicrobiales bacterium]
MEKIVFLDRSTADRNGPGTRDVDFSALEGLGQVISHDITNPEDTATRIADAEIVLTNKVVIGANEMDAAKNLKLIQVVATGVNNVDLDAARERNLAVCNVSGYSTEAVAQHVFASLLNLESNVHRFAAEPEKWAESPIFTRLDYPIGELAGKTLGIVGLGSIGKAVARIGLAFGMKAIALAREGSKGQGGMPRLPRDEFFAVADVVTLHCPLTPENHHFINAETLGQMKPSAILINTGRGDLVNEPALVEALKNHTIRAAAVDVLTPEPPSADHPFLTAGLDNLFITPHTAWSSLEARQRLIDGVIENIKAFQSGEERNRVL